MDDEAIIYKNDGKQLHNFWIAVVMTIAMTLALLPFVHSYTQNPGSDASDLILLHLDINGTDMSGNSIKTDAKATFGNRTAKFNNTGNTYIELENLAGNIYSGCGNFTIETWFYPRTLQTSYLLGHSVTGTPGNRLFIGITTTGIFGRIGNITGSTVALTVNKWYHYVMASTCNSGVGEFVIYINGVANQTNSNYATSGTPVNITLGRFSDTGGENFSGDIGSFVIYNYTRTPAQIAQSYQEQRNTSIYISKDGSDTADGLTPTTPIKTIARLNDLVFFDSLHHHYYFRAGHTWEMYYDEYISLNSGEDEWDTVYSRYGDGEKPKFLGYMNQSTTGTWTEYATNRWQSSITQSRDVGHIDCGNYSRYMNKAMNTTQWFAATEEGTFYHNATGDDRTYIYSTSNPATLCNGHVRLAYAQSTIGTALFDIELLHNITIDGLWIQGGSKHGIAGSQVVAAQIQNNTIRYIGGSPNNDNEEPTSVLGNGIQLGNSANYSSITGNNVSEVVDACITFQRFSDVGKFHNLTITGNVGYKCLYPFEYFNSDNTGRTQNITENHNTWAKMGEGYWYGLKDFARLRFESTPGGSNTADFEQKNNVIGGSYYKLWQQGATSTTWDAIEKVSSDYNFWFRNSTSNPTTPFTINGSSKSFTQLQALGIDLNSQLYNDTSDFVDYENDDFTPLYGSEICTMSSTGSYVGAIACTADTPPSAPTNLKATGLNNQSIYITWTDPTDPDLSHIQIWYNTSTASTNYTDVALGIEAWNITLLGNNTYYTIMVMGIDTAGNSGTNASITNLTSQNIAPSDPVEANNTCTIPGPCYANVTFSQKPFVVEGWLTLGWRASNSTSIRADSTEYECIDMIGCSNIEDGNLANFAYDSTHAIVYTYSNYSYTDAQNIFRINYTISGTISVANVFTAKCVGAGTLATHANVVSQTTYSVDIPSSCKNSGKVQFYLEIERSGSTIRVHEIDAMELSNFTATANDVMFFSNYTTVNQSINLTSAANDLTDNVLNFIFNSSAYQVIIYNSTFEVIYNKSINVSIFDSETNATLDPSCTFNSDTISPKSELLYFNSSLDNDLNCTLAGYSSLFQSISPLADAYNFTMGGVNVNISIYDEQTNRLINQTMFVYIIRQDYAVNYTTTNGTLDLGYINIPAGDIEIRYGGSGYVTRSYYLTDLPTSSLDLYSLKESNASLVVFTITDEKGKPVNGAYLKAQRYFIEDNAYKLVSMEKTDINGEAGMYLEPYTVPYIFIVEKDSSVVFTSSTSGTKIFTSTVAIRVNLLSDILESFYNLNNFLTVSLTFNNATKTFTYTWNDASGIVNQACLKVEKHTMVGVTEIGESCTSSASGTINFDITSYWSNSSTFRAKGNLDTSTQYSPYPTQILDILTLNPMFETLGKPGLFFSFLFIITMFFIGLAINPTVAVIYTAVSMIVVNIVGFGLFGWAMIISITIMGLIYSLSTAR